MEVEDDMFLDDDVDILDIIKYGFPRRIYIRSHYLHNMDDLTFLRRFRLTKPTVLAILAQIEGQLKFNNNLNNSISPINQLLTTLRFYASAGHQNSLADFMGMHQTRVICCIDCTHIKIQSPVARWPGSTHDMTIFNNSRIRARIEAGEYPNTVLLGDAGYMLRPYFLTPIANPNTQSERLYNESHIRTRNVVERMFGVWKRRFPVLAYGLRCKLTTSLTIVVAAAILHNIAVDM
ncbi:hypothetical protein RN001_003762 [Aquatica leii]|uniref:DDE Tnp4 domain-containing protein n=1 Tax=Aquatica leii TaxID=1421715 RepID=A0AAN7SE87_9COLE|nr:hypothetical protein RN001_003762 [Aquatica leii]